MKIVLIARAKIFIKIWIIGGIAMSVGKFGKRRSILAKKKGVIAKTKKKHRRNREFYALSHGLHFRKKPLIPSPPIFSSLQAITEIIPISTFLHKKKLPKEK